MAVNHEVESSNLSRGVLLLTLDYREAKMMAGKFNERIEDVFVYGASYEEVKSDPLQEVNGLELRASNLIVADSQRRGVRACRELRLRAKQIGATHIFDFRLEEMGVSGNPLVVRGNAYGPISLR